MPPHSTLTAIPENTALNLGSYVTGAPCNRQSITDYSRFTYDSTGHQMLMFGGGHAATPRTDVDVLDLNVGSTLIWTPAYASTALTDMTDANLDKTIGKWINTGHPLSRHTYDLLPYAPNVNRLLLLGWGGSAPNCTTATWGFTPIKTWHYNPTSKAWAATSVNTLNTGSGAVSEYDPVSGKIIIGTVNGLWTYDPATPGFTQVKSWSQSFGGSGNLMYFPPNQKMYWITRESNPTVWELTLDRADFTNSTLTQVTGITGGGPQGGTETGYAYDPSAQIIGGGVLNGVFYAYNPVTKVWSSRTMTPSPSGTSIGTVAFHALDFDPVNGVFIFLTNNGSGRRTYAYRYAASAAPTLANNITIHNTSGATITNRPISIARPFAKGELAGYAQAVIGATPVTTQCDVKNRWSDGSLKFAIVSFILPSLGTGLNVAVSFQNQATGNNTGFLDQTGMLATGYNFGGTITLASPTRTANARTMLTAGSWRYWLQGPIVTAVIIEDRTTARTYDLDMGDGTKALHPIFEAWFYPQGNRVQLGYTMENCWGSNTSTQSMKDQTYSTVLASGNTSPTTELTLPSYTHIGKSRWHRVYWLGTDPPSIRVDHNLNYLVTTKAIPNYDLSITPEAQYEDSRYTNFETQNNDFDDNGLYSTDLDGTGAADWIGLHNTWETLWLYSMSANGWAMVTGNADQAGVIPMFFRDAESQAGTGNWFDQQYTQQTNLSSAGAPFGTGTVDTFGRVISINARRTVGMRFLSGVGVDEIITGTITNGGFPSINTSHLPDVGYIAYLFTGRYYYLELLQMSAAYCIANKDAGWGNNFARPGDVGLINHTNVRGDAWGVKTPLHAAFISPDSTPEQAYFIDKFNDNVAMWEGLMNLTLSYPAKQQQWNWGRNVRSNLVLQSNGVPSPIGQWQDQGGAFIQQPLNSDGTLAGGTGAWEENFLLCTLGRARDMEISTTGNILQFMAKKRFRINLTTVPGVTLQNFIEAFRDPTLSNLGIWMQNMTEWVSHYRTDQPPYTGRNLTGLNPDHSYAFIALAADSFLVPYVVDGFNGQTAWETNKTLTPNQHQFSTGHTNASPKWAIVPYNQSGGTPPTPPAVPQNLRKVSN